MSVLIASEVQSPLGGIINPHLSTDMLKFSGNVGWPPDPVHEVTPSPDYIQQNHYPVSAAPRPTPAEKVRSYVDDFYYRVHVIPRALNVGVVLDRHIRNVTVWNAWFDAIAFTSLGASNTDGLLIDEPIVAPDNFEPLEYFTYDITVTPQGPAVINAQYTWQINGRSEVFSLTGLRAVLFAYQPHWQDPVVETLSAKTRILRAIDGTESATALRPTQRRRFEYGVAILDAASSQNIENVLWGWQARPFGLLVPTDETTLTAPTNIGDTTIYANTEYFGFADGGRAVLLTSEDDFEIVEIDTVSVDSLLLTRPVETARPLGTLLQPMEIARVPAKVGASRLTDDKSLLDLRWDCDPVQTDPVLPEAPAPLTYQGGELYLNEPNWARPPQYDHIVDTQTFDPGTGALYVEEYAPFPDRERDYNWLFEGRAAIHAFREFLGRRDGARVPVWMPTWHSDLTLVLPTGLTSTAIAVRDSNYNGMVLPANEARKHFFLLTHSGDVFTREIIGATSNGDGTEDLEMDTSIGEVINPEDVAIMCYLQFWRMNDVVSLVWHTSTLVEAKIKFRSVKAW